MYQKKMVRILIVYFQYPTFFGAIFPARSHMYSPFKRENITGALGVKSNFFQLL